MYERPYQNREIDEKFKEIQETLDRIETQTTKTNGRVRWNEKMIWLAMGFCGCISLLVLPLIWSLIGSGKL